jgi:hypothetical protein
MKRARFPRFPSLLLLLMALLFWLSSNAQAQSGGGYDLSWSTIDGGGATFSSGGSYSLGGTIGQADAEAMLSGGSYTLSGGFWGSGLIPYGLYLPLVLRNP